MCGKIYSNWICPKCYLDIKKELEFKIIDEKNFRIFFIGFYEKQLRQLLLKFKFKDSAYISNMFTTLIMKNEQFVSKIKNYDYIISVPMFKKNKVIRGYNQTETLAQNISEKIKVDCLFDILTKIKENKKQSLLNEKERVENVKNVYSINNYEILKNKKVLLLDDIYTTGNTIKECIRTLRKAKIQKIDVLVIAKRN